MSSESRGRRVLWLSLSIVALVSAVYLAPALMHLDPYVRSEVVVRDFVKTVGQEVGAYRREVRRLLAQVKEGSLDVMGVVTASEEAAKNALAMIAERSDIAQQNVPDDIRVTTQLNRVKRIRQREEEAQEAVHWLAQEATTRLRGRAPDGSE